MQEQPDQRPEGEEREGEEGEDAHLHLHAGLPEARVYPLGQLQAGESALEERDIAQQFLLQRVREVGGFDPSQLEQGEPPLELPGAFSCRGQKEVSPRRDDEDGDEHQERDRDHRHPPLIFSGTRIR